MKIIEYSEVSRQKITDLRQYLTEEFGDKTSKKIVRKLLDTIDNLSLNEKIGEAFLPMWHWLYEGHSELNNKEIIHLSCSFTYLFFYFICYILFYIPLKFVFIGSNPNIHKPIKTVTRIIYIIFFMLSTYGVAFVFLAQIRQILPFPDGFLSFFFNLLYQIEV